MTDMRGTIHVSYGSSRQYLMYDVWINDNNYKTLVHRIIGMYAVGHMFGPETDVHHRNGKTQDNSPSNLAIAPNRRVHKLLDIYTRIQKLTGKPVTVKVKEVIYVGDIITDDNFDVEIALEWWLERVQHEGRAYPRYYSRTA